MYKSKFNERSGFYLPADLKNMLAKVSIRRNIGMNELAREYLHRRFDDEN